MKIGVLSDIHLREDDGSIQSLIDDHLQDVDMIFLCGDLTSMEIYHLFDGKEVAAVAGNMDDRSVKTTLPIKRVIEACGHKIGLIHGFGPPIQMESRILREFKPVDCIVFGHTHSAENKMIGDTMFFNPGSPTDKRFAPYNSIGILDVSEDKIDGRIIKL